MMQSKGPPITMGATNKQFLTAVSKCTCPSMTGYADCRLVTFVSLYYADCRTCRRDWTL